MRCLGDSVLPVIEAGQNSMQRPHSVQARRSSRWRQVRSFRPFAPKTELLAGLRLGFQVHLPQRAARLEVAEVDVRLAADDVEVLAVRQVRAEGQHEADVRPGEDPVADRAASLPKRLEHQVSGPASDGPRS